MSAPSTTAQFGTEPRLIPEHLSPSTTQVSSAEPSIPEPLSSFMTQASSAEPSIPEPLSPSMTQASSAEPPIPEPWSPSMTQASSAEPPIPEPWSPSMTQASSNLHLLPQTRVDSPSIPSPGARDIPETPQHPLAPTRRPFESPVRAMRNLDEHLLDPVLRPRIASSSSRRDPTPTQTASDVDLESSDEDLPRSQSNTPLEGPNDATKKRGKRPRLTPENVQYQPDKRKRESYYRNTGERLKKNLRIMGAYTGCIGVLYLHRYQTLRLC